MTAPWMEQVEMITHRPPELIDEQTLSSYLDGQLSVRDTQRLEGSLVSDARLANDLATLRYTKNLLVEVPRVPTPRAFTLNEAMAGAPRRPRPRVAWTARFQPAALRSMAALASLLLVVLLLGDFNARDVLPGAQTAQVESARGGLAADQGDPSAVAAKTSTEAAALTPTFLGLSQSTLLALEVGLAALAALLLVAAWQLSRAP